MEVANVVADNLSPISNAFIVLNTVKVHPVFYPFALGSTLHAARVSINFQSMARRSPTPLSWGQHITGFLIVAWGGGLLSSLLLGLPSPVFYLFYPYVNYISVHLFMTAILNKFPQLLHLPLLDTILWPLDAIFRTNGIASTLDLLSHTSVYPDYKYSLFTHMLLGATTSAGGGTIVGTFNGWTSTWTISTPPFLRAGAGWDGTLDVWGGALVALIYSAFTGHPAFSSLTTGTQYSITESHRLTPLRAKAIAAAVLGILFAARTIKMHWLASSRAAGPSNERSAELTVDAAALDTKSSDQTQMTKARA